MRNGREVLRKEGLRDVRSVLCCTCVFLNDSRAVKPACVTVRVVEQAVSYPCVNLQICTTSCHISSDIPSASSQRICFRMCSVCSLPQLHMNFMSSLMITTAFG